MAKTFNNNFRELAMILSETYKNPNNRRPIMKVKNIELNYMRDKSNDLYAHYQNNDLIILAIHGANDISLNKIAIKKYLKIAKISTIEKSVCNKLQELRNEKDKKVLVIAHSLGCYMSGKCYKDLGFVFKSVYFAPFLPLTKDSIVQFIMKNPNIKKLIYKRDLFSTNGLDVKGINNLLLFDVYNPFFNATTNNGHSISNFETNKPFNHFVKYI